MLGLLLLPTSLLTNRCRSARDHHPASLAWSAHWLLVKRILAIRFSMLGDHVLHHLLPSLRKLCTVAGPQPLLLLLLPHLLLATALSLVTVEKCFLAAFNANHKVAPAPTTALYKLDKTPSTSNTAVCTPKKAYSDTAHTTVHSSPSIAPPAFTAAPSTFSTVPVTPTPTPTTTSSAAPTTARTTIPTTTSTKTPTTAPPTAPLPRLTSCTSC